MTVFDFSERDSVYVPIYFKPLNTQTMLPFRFKIDTGADSSTISKEDLQDLGYSIKEINEGIIQRGLVTLANNTTIEAGTIQIPLINILSYECKQWPFTIIVEEGKDFKNLLGRDLLAGFNYTFNNDEKKFKIEKSKTFSYFGRRFAGQLINELEQQLSKASS